MCTCTSSDSPLFDGAALPSSSHVVAVGSHEPTAREVDTEAVRRAWVVVEDRPTALREAGEVVIPLKEGAIGQGHLRADLRELVATGGVGHPPLTLFKSVGMGWQDLAVASAAYERWQSAR